MSQILDNVPRIVMVLMIITIINLGMFHKKLNAKTTVFFVALIINLVVELLGYNTPLNQSNINYYVYGLFLIFFFLYFIFFYLVIKKIILKRIVLFSIALFLVLFFAFLVKNQFTFTDFPSELYYLDFVILFICISIFMYEILNSEKIFYLKNYFPFWIALSLLIFYIVLIPALTVKMVEPSIYLSILLFLNIFGYTLLNLGIIWSKKND